MSATPTQLSLRVKTLPLKNTVNNFVVHKDDAEMPKHWTIPMTWGLTITEFLHLNNVAVTCLNFTGLSELQIRQINDMSGRRRAMDQADRSKKERPEVSLFMIRQMNIIKSGIWMQFKEIQSKCKWVDGTNRRGNMLQKVASHWQICIFV